MAFPEVLGWWSGTAGAPLGMLQQGGDRGRGRAWQGWQSLQPHPIIPALISHPDSPRLRTQDAAGQLILLAPIIAVSAGLLERRPFLRTFLVFILHLIEADPTQHLLILVYFLGPALQECPDHLSGQI